MAEFPTYEEMAKNVAEKVLDDFLYNGKSIREWMQIISSEDCISRKEAIKSIKELFEMGDCYCDEYSIIGTINQMPSIQPKSKTDVLDKIRAEIEALEDGISSYHNDRPWIFKDEVLQIIDKYKAESEDKE